MLRNGRLQRYLGGGLALVAIYSIASNFFFEYLDIDKFIEKPIAVAGSTVMAKKTEGFQSMEGLLEEASIHANSRRGENTAIWFKSEFYNMDNLANILDDAKLHAHGIGLLDEAYRSNKLPEDAPEWVRMTYQNTLPSETDTLPMKRLLSSEMAKTISSAYEAFNDAVSGGVNASGEKVSQKIWL